MKSLLLEVIACPVCKVKVNLSVDKKRFECPKCGCIFQIEGDIPIMMTTESQARINTLIKSVSMSTKTADWQDLKSKHPLRYRIYRLIKPPHYGGSLHHQIFSQLITILEEFDTTLRVLVVGSGVEEGHGMKIFNQYFKNTKVNLDVVKYPSVDIVGDGVNLPFLNESFHCVIMQGVIEHVADSKGVADEITRVCLAGGYILITVPWMQSFHADPGDYQRYSVQGLSHLFSQFEVVNAGASIGPASAMHGISSDFFVSFSRHKQIRRGIRFVTRWIFSPILLLDFYLVRKKNAYITAYEVFIIGRKNSHKDNLTQEPI